MKGFLPLFLGILGTFLFSFVGLTMVPNAQIGHLDPQVNDQDEADVYPVPKSGMADRGRKVYMANGCVYCHTQQVRPDYAASDIARKWGERRSAPRDYIFEKPALLGKMRMGPDLANVGKRAPAEDANAPAPSATNTTTGGPQPPAPAGGTTSPATPTAGAPAPAPGGSAAPGTSAAPAPAGGTTTAANAGTPAPAAGQASPAPATGAPTAEGGAAPTTTAPNGAPLQYSAAWHHRHLYAPRSVTFDSTMPAYRFLYKKQRIEGQAAANAVQLTGSSAPEEGWEVVPSFDAECLVAYLMSLDQSHPLKEVKSTAPPSPPQPGQAAK